MSQDGAQEKKRGRGRPPLADPPARELGAFRPSDLDWMFAKLIDQGKLIERLERRVQTLEAVIKQL